MSAVMNDGSCAPGGTVARSMARWGGSLLLVLGAHGGLAAAMLSWRVAVEAVEPPPAAVMIDLAPMPVAPPVEQAPMEPAEPPPPEPPPLEEQLPEPDLPPEPVIEPEPLPEPLPEPPPVEPEVALPEPPPPPPKPKPKPKPKEPPRPKEPPVERPKPRQEVAPAPPPAPAAPVAPAAVAAAPAPGPVSTRNSRALPSWQGLLIGHLERHKRYPRSAQARRQEGVAQVRFVIDREGKVLSVRLEKSSGHEVLDAETVAMVERASPLPAPPPELARDRFELVVPVQFFIR